MALAAKNGKTNYFQIPEGGLTGVTNLSGQTTNDGMKFTWDTAYAGNDMIDHYKILNGNEVVGEVKHRPQIDKTPFSYVANNVSSGEQLKVVTVDAAGHESDAMSVVS